ncbi:MAG TPA: hypothetical protein EYG68_07710 [Leucothrix mucor]|nr:hypothetical protein [Leucothrix mucor]
MKKLFHLSLILALIILTIFWLSSYARFYNSIGVDSEQQKEATIDYHYYRFWWPGNGSLLIGRGITTLKYDPNKQYDRFDLGAAFFRHQDKKLVAQTTWNKIGFWYISPPAPVRQFWIGVPAWLPVLIILGYFGVNRRKDRK